MPDTGQVDIAAATAAAAGSSLRFTVLQCTGEVDEQCNLIYIYICVCVCVYLSAIVALPAYVCFFLFLKKKERERTTCIFNHRLASSLAGQDPDHSVRELQLGPAHNHSSSGWHSPKYCEYPQSIVFKLESAAQLKRIQILAHEFKIASRV